MIWRRKKDATPAQISLAWMLCKHPSIVPIPGTRKEERMKENAGAADVKLSLREVQALDDALAQMSITAGIWRDAGRIKVETEGKGISLDNKSPG